MASIPALLSRLKPDPFTLSLLGTFGIATVLPCSGRTAEVFGDVTALAIGLLFFLHGAGLPRDAIVAGITHRRLHLTVLCLTFVLFPVLGLLMQPLALRMLTPELYLGMLFLCMLPSTVQSSIAFTSLTRGNVAAAVCSASVSNFTGIFVTPLLVSAFVLQGAAGGRSTIEAVGAIVVQLLLPFIAGQLLRGRIGAWVDRHKPVLKLVDQGAILLVVYGAFSAAVTEGIWSRLGLASLAALCLLCCALLAIVLGLAAWVSRRLGFPREDAITIVFCGSKESLASGVPMAKVLFATSSLDMVILPLMLFHQIQLKACALLAQCMLDYR